MAPARNDGDAGVVALRHWNDAQLAALAERVAHAVRTWSADWGLPAIDGAQAVALAADAGAAPRDAHAWHPLHGAGSTRRAWLAAPEGGGDADDEAVALAGLALFGAMPSGDGDTAAEAVCRAAWKALAAALSATLALDAPADGTGDAPAAADCRAWSGAVVLNLPLAERPWRLLLNGACVAALVPAAPVPKLPAAAAPVPLLRALGEHTLPLRAELRGPVLTLGALRDLRPGDVVLLPHLLDEPLRLAGADGATVARGYLGSSDGARALELLAAAPPRRAK